MIYTVTLNPAVDYFVHTSDFTVGKVNRAIGEDIFFGGKGINVSIMLRTLGVESAALGFVAGFTGAAIEEGVRGMGINTDFVHLPCGFSRINVKIKGNEETELNGRGPEIGEAALDQLFEKLDRLAEGDLLVLAGSVPELLPPDIYSRITARLSDRGVLFAVDASGSLLRSVLPHKPFLIKPNHHELAELFGKKALSEDDIICLAGKLRDDGAQNVLVSRAGDGAILLSGDGNVYKIDAVKGKVINSVGAGDSMVAGFLAGWLKTGDYVRALALGAAAGSATAFSSGIAERELVESLSKSVNVRKIIDKFDFLKYN